MKLLIKIFMLTLMAQSALAQTTADSAITAALQNHPLTKASAFDVQAKMYAEKAAFNMPNPEINVESPTGEFYAVGVSQSFEFPTVYARQKDVAKAETARALAGQLVSENDLRYAVRDLYLEAQVAQYQTVQWRQRDSLYQQIATVAARQFDAGEIDFLQKTMAEQAAGKSRLERTDAEMRFSVSRYRLMTITGWSRVPDFQPLQPDTLWRPTVVITPETTPAVQYQLQSVSVAEQQVQLARSRALPNFSLGYLNQGARNTPLDYQFKASVGVPLWIGQYSAGKKAAASEVKSAQSRAEAEQQAVTVAYNSARMDWFAAREKVRYYEQEALPRSRSLIATALRMREAGQVDYVTFLRTLDEAYTTQRDYAAQLQAFETARIQMLYLAGQ